MEFHNFYGANNGLPPPAPKSVFLFYLYNRCSKSWTIQINMYIRHLWLRVQFLEEIQNKYVYEKRESCYFQEAVFDDNIVRNMGFAKIHSKNSWRISRVSPENLVRVTEDVSGRIPDKIFGNFPRGISRIVPDFLKI